MSGWVGPQCPGAFDSGPGVLSEIDRALALIGAARWMEDFSTGARSRDRRQSASIKWQLWGITRRRDGSVRLAGNPLKRTYHELISRSFLRRPVPR